MPRYKQTVAPTAGVEPVSLVELREQCSLSDNSCDAQLGRLLAEARDVLERQLSRQFMPATWQLTLDEFPAEIELEVLPVTAVSSVQYVDGAGATQTLSAASYQVDLSSPNQPARIKPAYGLCWPTTRSDTYNAVTVTFTAGSTAEATVPAAAKRALKLLVAHAFEHREAVTAESLSQVPLAMKLASDAYDPGLYC